AALRFDSIASISACRIGGSGAGRGGGGGTAGAGRGCAGSGRIATGGGAGGGGTSGGLAGGLLLSACAMIRRMEARISSIVGSCALAGWFICRFPAQVPTP